MGIPFSTDKKTHQNRIMDKLYLDRETTGDITFVVQSRKIRAHKCVLAAISPKYNTQFYGLQRDEGEILVEDVEAAEFEVFLQLFYLDEPELSMINIEGVLNLAKQSLVDEFVDKCANFLWSAGDTNFPLIYRLTHFYGLESHKKQCLLVISGTTSEHFKSDEFLDACNHDMLSEIIKLDSLNCEETEVFCTCIAWAERICSRENVDQEKIENLRAALGDILYEIRFLSMTFEEFAALHKSCEGLFTHEETVELMYMYGSVKDFKPQKFCPDIRNPEVLEISRILRQERTETRPVRIVPVSFWCNKAIRLLGFSTGFAFVHKDQIKLKVTITDTDMNTKVLWPKYTGEHLEHQAGSNVRLDETIDIKANDQVEFDVSSSELSLSTTVKYQLAKVMDMKDLEFTFKMEGESSAFQDNFLTRLFFYRKN